MVAHLRAIKYLKDGTIQYKLDFDDDWQDLPRRPKKISVQKSVWPPMYKDELKIEDRKWHHLQELKGVIPVEYHHFYDQLQKKSV